MFFKVLNTIQTFEKKTCVNLAKSLNLNHADSDSCFSSRRLPKHWFMLSCIYICTYVLKQNCSGARGHSKRADVPVWTCHTVTRSQSRFLFKSPKNKRPCGLPLDTWLLQLHLELPSTAASYRVLAF
jgi:hypothetical protein